MGQHHHHDHGTSNIGLAFFLNIVFTIIEIIGGLYTNSLAILSDAVHDLGDSLTLGLAWYFQKISKRPSDFKYTYGYKRFSVLGAIINSVILIIGSFFIISAAIPRIIDPRPTDATGMMILGALGIIFNGMAFFKLQHGQSHNERVVSLHILEDVLGWVAVLIGSIVIYFTECYMIDPILSLAISLFILYNVIKNIKSTLNIILQGTPDSINIDKVKDQIIDVEHVEDVHDIHVWTMDGEHNILTAHIVISDGIVFSSHADIKKKIHQRMLHFNIAHCTLEIESTEEDCVLGH